MRHAILGLVACGVLLLCIAAGGTIASGAAVTADPDADLEPMPLPTLPVVGTVTGLPNAKSLAVDSGLHQVYVALWEGNGTGNLAVIDGQAGVLRTVTDTQRAHPNGVAVDSANHKVYVTNADTNDLTMINPLTGDRRWVGVNASPWGVAVNPGLNRIYVANYNNASVTVIDGATMSVLYNRGGIPNAAAVAVDPGSNNVYVASAFANTYILNADGIQKGMILTADVSRGVAVDPSTHRVYVVKWDVMGAQPRLYIYEAGVASPYLLPYSPMNVAVNPNTHHVFVTMVDGGNHAFLAMLDGQSGVILAVHPLGPEDTAQGGQGIAVDTNLNRVYISLYQQGKLLIISDPLPATPTATRTATPSATRTATASATTTMTATSTRTATPPPVATLLPTSTPTPTVTATAIATSVTQETATATATPAPSDTPTVTPTPAPADTALPSPTNTTTPTATITVTSTATAPATTATATSTATFTATLAPSASATATPTATATKPAATATKTSTPLPTCTVGVLFTTTIGGSPKGLAVDPIRGRLYASMILENSVKVLNSSTGAFIKNLAVGSDQPNGIAVSAQTGMVYTANRTGGNVSAINADSGTYATTPSGYMPWGIAVDDVHNRLFAANFGTGSDGYTVAAIDASSFQAITRTNIGNHPALVAVDAQRARVYVTTFSSDAGAYVLDSNGNVLDYLLTGSGSLGVAVNSNSGRVYVTNRVNSTLYLLGPGTIRSSVNLGAPGYAVVVNPASNHVFVFTISNGQASLQVRDGDSGNLITSIALGAEDADNGGQGLTLDIATGRVYAVSYQTSLLTVVRDLCAAQSPSPTSTATVTASATRSSSSATPTVTQTAVVTPTFRSTPLGGWPYQALLPVIAQDATSGTATPTQTAVPGTPSPTPTYSDIDWQIPSLLHVYLAPANVTTGQTYWRLVSALYQDPSQSNQNHNVYYRLESGDGQGLLGLPVCLGFPWEPYLDCSHLTEQRGGGYPGGYSADLPLFADFNPDFASGVYAAWAGGSPSDRVIGLGLPLKQHVNFLLTFRLTIAP